MNSKCNYVITPVKTKNSLKWISVSVDSTFTGITALKTIMQIMFCETKIYDLATTNRQMIIKTAEMFVYQSRRSVKRNDRPFVKAPWPLDTGSN